MFNYVVSCVDFSKRVGVVFVGSVLRGVCRVIVGVWRWVIVSLFSFPPSIGLAKVVGLGIGTGWVLVGRARM